MTRQTGRPKQHHYVPQAYLKLFGRDGRVAVRWRDRDDVNVANVRNIAGQTGFYDTYVDGARSTQAEQRLAAIDGKAHAAIDAVIQTGKVPGASSAHRNALARFLAIQMTRTPEVRERVTFANDVLRYAGSRMVDASLVAEYLEGEHLGFRPKDGEVQGALALVQAVAQLGPLSQTEAVEIPLQGARRLAGPIFLKHWSVEVSLTKARFITSDAPLVLWRTPSFRDSFEGLGINNAD